MYEHSDFDGESGRDLFAPWTRLLAFAVLLPAAVAVFNQVLFSTATWRHAPVIYASMAVSTAVLSWCSGRYLSPAWLRWLIFAWSLALVDLLTIAACLAGPLPYDFAFLLVSAQVSLLVVWTILAPVNWQWRMPGTVVGAAMLIVFTSNWYSDEWGVLMVFRAVVVALVCGGLRWSRFALQHIDSVTKVVQEESRLAQFSLKHLLIWATALAPLLLVARGLDFLMFAQLDAQSIFPAILLSLCLATVNLLVIWAILGSGAWIVRIAFLSVVPFLVGLGLGYYAASYRPARLPWRWPDSPVLSLLLHMEEEWSMWIWLNAMLLAALLLFVRASGYRLARTNF